MKIYRFLAYKPPKLAYWILLSIVYAIPITYPVVSNHREFTTNQIHIKNNLQYYIARDEKDFASGKITKERRDKDIIDLRVSIKEIDKLLAVRNRQLFWFLAFLFSVSAFLAAIIVYGKEVVEKQKFIPSIKTVGIAIMIFSVVFGILIGANQN